VERLQTLLMSLLLTKQVVGNLTEIATPIVMRWMTEAKVRREGGRRGRNSLIRP
jgi:hypothetical protein